MKSRLHASGAQRSPDDDGSTLARPSNAVSGPQAFSNTIASGGDKSASIGLLLEQHNATRRMFIKSLMPGGPAQVDGRLKQGDRLLSVDGVAVQGLELSQVFDMIKGAPGTQACVGSVSSCLPAFMPASLPLCLPASLTAAVRFAHHPRALTCSYFLTAIRTCSETFHVDVQACVRAGKIAGATLLQGFNL